MKVQYFTSREMKAILKVSDCELMHMRTSGHLAFNKKGNSYFYALPTGTSVLKHPIGKQLIDWYKEKHPSDINNEPSNKNSQLALERLVIDLLLPLQRKYAGVKITYGFTSASLKRYIANHSKAGTAPDIDQHAASELNNAGKPICERNGAACDILVDGVSAKEVLRFIVKHLSFDRIYYYGANRPLHISSNSKPEKHLQIMKQSSAGRRYPSVKAFGDDAISLAESL